MMRSTWLDATMASAFAATLAHGRRLARDSVALVELAMGVAILVQGLRTALRERSADAEGAASVGTDIESIA
jgi:hypothetical protein